MSRAALPVVLRDAGLADSVTPYNPQFFLDLREGSRRSAKVIIPLVLELIRPASVIDVGCGLGTWLAVFRELGIDDVWGVDGDSVNESLLEIPSDRFIATDLRHPFRLARQFDLVVSMEVAEHLPEECAEGFVDSLVSLGPTILFSAAIPFQGGTSHLNEQWPDYWAKHFGDRAYLPIDCIRRRIWRNQNVEWWYAQNIIMFARRDHLEAHSLLNRELETTAGDQLSIVHPRKYLELVEWMNLTEAARANSQE